MGFLLLLLVGLSTMISVETRAAATGKTLLQARMNARLGALMALGGLQRALGPDARISASAALFDDTEAGHEGWLGAWKADANVSPIENDIAATLTEGPDNGDFLGWIVSGNESGVPSRGGAHTPDSLLPEEGRVGIAVPAGYGQPYSELYVPKVGLSSGTGSYAFWVEDEGQKAFAEPVFEHGRVTVNNSGYRAAMAPLPFVGEDYEANRWLERERLRYLMNQRPQMEALHFGQPSLPSIPPQGWVGQLDGRTAFASPATLALTLKPLSPRLQDLRAGWTPYARSIPVNVPEGKLKYDLSDSSRLTDDDKNWRLSSDAWRWAGAWDNGTFDGHALALFYASRHMLDTNDERSNPTFWRPASNYRTRAGLTNADRHEGVLTLNPDRRLQVPTEFGIKILPYKSDIYGSTPAFEPADRTYQTQPGDTDEYLALALEVFIENWNPTTALLMAEVTVSKRTRGLKITGLPGIKVRDDTSGEEVSIDLNAYVGKIVWNIPPGLDFYPGEIRLLQPDDERTRVLTAHLAPEDSKNKNPTEGFDPRGDRFHFNRKDLAPYDPSLGLPIERLIIVTDKKLPVHRDAAGEPTGSGHSLTVTIDAQPVENGIRIWEIDDATAGVHSSSSSGYVGLEPFDGGAVTLANSYNVSAEALMGWGGKVIGGSGSDEEQRALFLRMLREYDPRNELNQLPVAKPVTHDSDSEWSSNPVFNGNLEPAQNFQAGNDAFFYAEPDYRGPGWRIFDYPRQEIISVSAFNGLPGPKPQSIGNPWGGSANRIYDSVFFSTLPRQTVGGMREDVDLLAEWDGMALPNSATELYVGDPQNPAIPGYAGVLSSKNGEFWYSKDTVEGMMRGDQAAANILLRGGFNLNSTSADAWRIMLSGARLVADNEAGQEPFRFRGSAKLTNDGKTLHGDNVYLDSGDGDGETELRNAHFAHRQFADSLPRYFDNESLAALAAKSGFLADQEFKRVALSQGVRELTEAQVDFLAEELVSKIQEEVQSRGYPFTSVREFLNAGVLDEILDPTGKGAEHPNALFGNYPYGAAYLSQADLLSGIAHQLTPRSDTFLIRGVGFAGGTDGEEARADVEVLVQRVPTPVNVGALPEVASNYDAHKAEIFDLNTDAVAHIFGRQFRILGFRWLD